MLNWKAYGGLQCMYMYVYNPEWTERLGVLQYCRTDFKCVV